MRRAGRGNRAFTLVEILIAIGILGLALTAIYATWTSILRASKVGLDAAAAVQRSRIAMRTIEDALLCVQSFAANQRYYGFVCENGSEGMLSFVARLPQSFPRSGKFGDLDVRRLEFKVESGGDSGHQLVLRQRPLLMDFDRDEQEHPLVLAKFVSEFKVEFYDMLSGEWTDEWTLTNQMPKLVWFSLKLADNAKTFHHADQELTREVSLPANTVLPAWQSPFMGNAPGAPQPGQPGGPGFPGPGGGPLPGGPGGIRPGIRQ